MSLRPVLTPFGGHSPVVDPEAYVDPWARLIGRVEVKSEASVWPGAVLRADEEMIVIGQGSAVLDLCLLEAPRSKPVIVAPGALISHQATLHGAKVKEGALIGIGAIVLDGAVVNEGALVGAGALVPPDMEVPAGVLVLGQPARVFRPLKPAERENIAAQLAEVRAKAQQYLALAQREG